MAVIDDIFKKSRPGKRIAAYGAILAAVVTVGLFFQAIDWKRMGFSESSSELRWLVLGFHLATVFSVFVETDSKFRGKNQIWSQIVIGSGILATFSQTAVVATTVGGGSDDSGFAWAFAILAIQSYANALMVALLIAEAWYTEGATPLLGSSLGWQQF